MDVKKVASIFFGEKMQSKLTKCYERLFVFMNYIIDILCVNRALEEDESTSG